MTKLRASKLRTVLLAVLLLVPGAAWAANVAGKLMVNGRASGAKTLVVNGVPYVRASDVAAMTGMRMSYNARTRTVSFARPGATGNGESTPPVGGSTQRAGNEGKVGELLVTPIVAIRIDSIKAEEQYGKPVTIVRGKIRNTSQSPRNYTVDDAALASRDGDTIKFELKANEIGGKSLLLMQKAEQTSLEITFPGAHPDATRAVITLQDWNTKIKTVFRVRFE